MRFALGLYQYIAGWFEWQDAKCWAKAIHPGWLHCYKKCKHIETQAYYKAKILAAYRGGKSDERKRM